MFCVRMGIHLSFFLVAFVQAVPFLVNVVMFRSAFLSAVCFGRTDMDRENAGVFAFGIVSGFACKRMVLHDALGAFFERRV